MGEPIVLFDGVCNLCNGSVQFLLKRDPERRFRFAALQSDAGRSLMAEHGLIVDSLSSVVLIEGGKVWQESSAALRIARRLPGAWKLLWVFAAVPRPLRDAVYRWIARNRYRWFGKAETCWLPTPELEARFLS
ncbi:MAG TPA: thiol-disulfide oxidoreductase DCC family protein [Thermoanaerobaculia bacterium]|jgi:predicted DCC family thiol-disulfide oxidoreductase YuxK|nr:thiol-disulfide oxidoreductase DCC family protein [Thermoanaerobaculia bacterium]